MHCKGLPVVTLPRLYWEFVEADVKELDCSISASDHYLILVLLRPRQIIQGILSVEPEVAMSGALMTGSRWFIGRY